MFTHYVCSAYEYTLYIPIYTYTFIVIYFIINYESSMWPAIPGIFGKGNWVDLKLEGDVSAAPFGDGCKKGI